MVGDCSKEYCPWNTKKGECDFQGAESVVMELRAREGNSKSSEHTELFTMGHGEENFAERIYELQ